MAHSDGKITAPVNTDDVATVLGVNSHDVGYLCSNAHGKINKWAKHKPVKAMNKYDTTETTYKSDAGNCGLTPPAAYTSRSALIDGMTSGTGTGSWTYDPPTGGDFPYRLTDFDGYDNNAVPPFGSIPENQTLVLKDVVIAAAAPAGTNLTLDDFSHAGYGQWYFGILLHHNTKNYNLIATATSNLSGMGTWQINIGQLAKVYAGTYTAYPFISSKIWTYGGNDPAFVQMVGIENKGVTVRLLSQNEAYQVSINWYYTTGNTVSYKVTIKNITNASVNLLNCTLRFAKTSTGGNVATNVVQFGNITVNAGATVTKTGTINLGAADYQYANFLYSALMGDQVTWIPIMPVSPGGDIGDI